ncbi:MAG: hypothetical protein QXR13_02610 [Candidatus Bathyarchaeia archaeon]
MSLEDAFMEDVDVKDLLRRLDDLARVLKIISDDLTEIMGMLRAYIESSVESGRPAFKPSLTQPARAGTIDDVQKAFPKDLLGLLIFEITDDYIIIKPKQYLGSECLDYGPFT